MQANNEIFPFNLKKALLNKLFNLLVIQFSVVFYPSYKLTI